MSSEPVRPSDEVVREYRSDRITVEWRAGLCIHSANCVRALPQVFRPKQRPWIVIDAADAEAIASAVERCPSGALRYVRHEGEPGAIPQSPS